MCQAGVLGNSSLYHVYYLQIWSLLDGKFRTVGIRKLRIKLMFYRIMDLLVRGYGHRFKCREDREVAVWQEF
jgi:hypothetical protein